jgi:hypothetical protein
MSPRLTAARSGRVGRRVCAAPHGRLREVDVACNMLHLFLTSNRANLIEHCRVMVGHRSDLKVTKQQLVHGIPAFLDQLIETLKVEHSS